MQWIAGILSIVAFFIYIWNIWKGNVRPSRSSWWIVSIVWLILLLSSVSLAPGDTLIEKWNAVPINWLSLAYIIGSFIIAISSLWRGSPDPWGILDWVCALLAVLSIILFFVFDEPLASLITSLSADIFGILPTVKNAWRYPYNEHLLAWALEVVASVLTIFAVTSWSFDILDISNWIGPIYLTLMNGIITLLIVRRYLVKRNNLINTYEKQ